MQNLWKYCHIVRLRSSGSPAAVLSLPASSYLETHYSEFINQDPLADRAIQTLLMQEVRQQSAPATLSLRCYISHTILTICKLIVTTYSSQRVELAMIASRLLTDDGELAIDIQYNNNKLSIQPPFALPEDSKEPPTKFQPIAYKILEKFDPTQSALSTWTTKLTRQSNELKQVLKEEYGILLITDWALLNDTKPTAWRKILINYYDYAEQPETSRQILDRQVAILNAYQQVYLKNHHSTPGKLCQPPTLSQCQEMMRLLGITTGDPGEFLDEQIRPIAQRIRQYRLNRVPQAKKPDSLPTGQPSQFGDLFESYLKGAITAAIAVKVATPNPTPSQRARQLKILKALHYLYQQGLSQGEIAKILGFSGQDRVSKLLSLKEFYASLKFHMLIVLKKEIPAIAAACDYPDRLLTVEAAISDYLAPLIDQDKAWISTPLEKRQQPSHLAILISECLSHYPIEST